MITKAKNCKGTTPTTKGLGCGQLFIVRTFGLCPKCLYSWATSTDVGREWFAKQTQWKLAKNKKEERAKDRKVKDDLNDRGAMRLADMYFSRYVRLFFSKNGYCTCFTCGTIVEIKEVQNGHYQKRVHKATRYEFNNCRPQCATCNGDVRHNGKQDVFRVNLVMQLGEEEVRRIEKLATIPIQANNVFFRKIAEKYRLLVNEIQSQLNLKYW